MSDFANNLRKLRKSRKLTLEELANDLNRKFGTSYNKSMISKWELEQVDPYMDTVRNLSIYFDIPLDELLGIRIKDPKLSVVDKFIPIIGVISAGTPLYAEEHILGYTACPPFKTSVNRSLFYLKVKGDSMDKEFSDGADVLVDRDADVRSGDIAVVMVNGFDATVKKVRFEDDHIILIPMSNNDQHYAQKYDLAHDEISIVGKVIGAFKSY